MPALHSRDLGIVVGDLQPGPLDAITDLVGTMVGRDGFTAHALDHELLLEALRT